jgi:hypothetical protein
MRAATSLVTAFILAFGGLALAQTWVEYRPAGAGFRIEMPGKAKVNNEAVKTDVGMVPSTTAVVEVGTSVAYVVMHSSYPDKVLAERTPERILDGVRDGSVKGKVLRSEQKLTVGGYPARRLIIDDNKEGFVFLSLIVLVGPQLNQAIFVSQTKGAEASADAKRFVDSFAIVDR